uniref:Uncharacterized protein n=1 Tax=Romanomermis culicivorax TaxID=13658 RepID=A0A915L2L7_ROMCU
MCFTAICLTNLSKTFWHQTFKGVMSSLWRIVLGLAHTEQQSFKYFSNMDKCPTTLVMGIQDASLPDT